MASTGAPGEGRRDEFPDILRQLRDIADGAGTRPLGRAKGLANQIRDVDLPLAAGFGGLNKHLLLLIR